MHPVQPEEIDARTGGNAALLDRSALGIEDRQLHPVETIAISVRPDDGADVFLAQIQRADTVDTERRQRRWRSVWSSSERIAGVAANVSAASNEVRIALVGGGEQVFGVIGKRQRSVVYAQHAP